MHPMVLLTMMLGLVGAVGVIQLDTASFEGTTQAATGQTTGIWCVIAPRVAPDLMSTPSHCNRLVHFRSADCPPCDDTTAIMARYDPAAFHGVAIRMAEVDVDRNRALFKRFQMLQVPAIVLFRNRHMYVYPHNPLADTQESSLEAMVAFAQQTYASSAELAVPGMQYPGLLMQFLLFALLA